MLLAPLAHFRNCLSFRNTRESNDCFQQRKCLKSAAPFSLSVRGKVRSYSNSNNYGAPFVKILYLSDLAQKLLSLRRNSYLCVHLAISAQR